MRRIGIYAGTFDPIHRGHMTFALRALDVCGLDKIVVLPERMPRGKTNVSDFAHRVAMIELAIKDYPKLELHELDDAQFSVEYTLPRLQDMHRGARLTLLIGSDNALAMNPRTWPGVERLYATAEIAVGIRESDKEEDLDTLGRLAIVHFVHTDYPLAAATKVREGRLDMIIPEVKAYIVAHGLYGSS